RSIACSTPPAPTHCSRLVHWPACTATSTRARTRSRSSGMTWPSSTARCGSASTHRWRCGEPVSSVEINGGEVVYEVVGPQDGIPVVLTPGGRANRDFMRPLAERLAVSGVKTLIWDRPNGGASDVQFSDRWRSESHMHADTLRALIDH